MTGEGLSFTLTWQSSSPRVLQGNSSVSTAGQVSSVLVISRLQPSDANTVISCIAINNQLEVPPSAAVRLDIVLAPVRVEMSRTVSSFLVGQSYNITCQVPWWSTPCQSSEIVPALLCHKDTAQAPTMS